MHRTISAICFETQDPNLLNGSEILNQGEVNIVHQEIP